MAPAFPPQIRDALARLRWAVRRSSPQQLVLLHYVLATLAGNALARVTVTMGGETAALGRSEEPSQGEPDAALTAGQSARLSGWQRGNGTEGRAGFSPRWFYDHADELPFRVGGKGRRPVRFSRRGLRAWLSAQ